ncbi:MAG: F0F1 ATP synthase subunit delta [Desulfovibrionaceae bacterium]|nr:F0F1 ATP synthase subunit delta [Desulfovibrionaceae bacterium]
MSNNIATRRYAQAIFDIGRSKGQADLMQIGRDLEALKECLDISPELANLFANPVFSNDEKGKVLNSLLDRGDVSEITKNFCRLLLEKGRLPLLTDIATAYQDMLDQMEGIIRSELITAVELSPERQAEIKSSLEAKSGKKLAMTFSVDPDIIGGLILKIDDRALDGSLRAQINILRENMKRGE